MGSTCEFLVPPLPFSEEHFEKERLSVAVVITRLVRGGAQRIALESACGLPPARFRTTLITGTQGGGEDNLLSEARARGVTVVEVPALGREVAPLRDFIALGKLKALFSKERFDIVHSHTSKAGFLASMAARRARVPVILYSPHGHIFGADARVPGVTETHRVKRYVFKLLRRHAERCAHRVVALNALDFAEQVALQLAPPEKYAIVENGIDLGLYRAASMRERAAIRAEVNTPADAFVVVSAGRLSSEKGHDLLIDAMSFVQQRSVTPTRPLVLWIAGNGSERQDLERHASTVLPAASYRFLGMRSDLPRLLAAADLFALPSRYESQGLVLMEAMAAGLPIVAAKVGGVPSIIRDGETGLLVPPGAAAELATAIGRLRGDRGISRRLAANGRLLAQAQFGLDKMLGRLTALYEDEWDRASRAGRAPHHAGSIREGCNA